MSYAATILLLGLSVAVLAAILTASAAGVLAWIDGASPAAAVTRAGIAFGGFLTLALLAAGLIVTVVR
jgi:hypothetical protein